MTHLFVSHATADDTVVTRIHDLLESAGVNTWVDHKDIHAPMDWETAIQEALNTCTAGLYVLSPRSANRDEIRPEIRTLLALNKPLYVALIEHMPPHQFPYRLRTIQYVDLSKDFAAGMATLISAVQGGRPISADAPHILREFHLTGTISPELHIPMSGRDADLDAVLKHLAGGYVTSILGVGGLGKSRLAAEVVLRDEWAEGAVWYVASDYSTAEDALALLREHLALPATANRADVLHAVRAKKTLLVIDNAESVTDVRLPDYVKLVNDLKAHNARVLITGRVEWDGIKLGREHHTQTLEVSAARQVVLDMRDALGVPDDLTAHAERIAIAARQHPRLIEWSVRKMKKFPPEKVIRELETFKGKDVQTALDGMIRQTVEQMTAQHGDDYVVALRQLCVFRGGFTYRAAGVVLGLVIGAQPSDQPTRVERFRAMVSFLRNVGQLDDEVLEDRLTVLQAWQFVTYADERYTVNSLVLAVVGEDATSHQPHYDYFVALARIHEEMQDYASLDIESDNLTATFEWALGKDAEYALWLALQSYDFAANRGRFRQNLDWFGRLMNPLAGYSNDIRSIALNRLGTAYGDLSKVEDREINLRRAIYAYEDALRYIPSEKGFSSYAIIQNNLGVSYNDLADTVDRENNLRRAIQAYNEAIKYWETAKNPLNYALTKSNLGNTYRELAQIEDQELNLRRAIQAYTDVLKLVDPSMPLDYATIKNNLGGVYWDLAKIANREENLLLAKSAYTEALQYRTATAAPFDFALTQYNLGLVLAASNDLAGAFVCWREAENKFRRIGAVSDADEILRWIAEVESKLNAPSEE